MKTRWNEEGGTSKAYKLIFLLVAREKLVHRENHLKKTTNITKKKRHTDNFLPLKIKKTFYMTDFIKNKENILNIAMHVLNKDR